MKRPAYQRYKPSGVEWLGDIPEHWETKKLRYLTNIRKGRLPNETFSSPSTENDLPYLSMEFLRNETESPNYVTASPKLVVASEGDLLLLWDGSNAGEFLIAKTGVVSSTAAYFEPINIHKRFLFFVCKALEPQIKDQTIGMGIPHVSGDELKSYYLPFPDLVSQQAIASFLDRETERVDRLVVMKRKLIERLKEKRTALISRTVTRGLPPAAGLPENPPLKPSGIDWLGDIPAHWQILKIKRVTISRCDGPFGSGLKSEHYCNEGVRVIRLQNIRFGKFDNTDTAFIDPDYYKELGDHTVLPGDVLIAGLGDENHPVGRACVAPETLGPAMVKADCFRFRLASKHVKPAFVALQLSTIANALAGALSTGTTRGRMNLSSTETRELALPPLTEQAAIISFLNTETAKLDTLTTEVEQAIERLQEYRIALITTAVTGKIDVRKESHA